MSERIPRGGVVGILGGGQLGRMMAHAAHRLGYKTHIFTTKRGSATQVSSRKTVSAYDDVEALEAFADDVDVVTYEFENVPAFTARFLAERVPVRPGARALAICQDRIAEKTFLADEVGVPTAEWAPAHGPDDVAAFVERFDGPCVLKTARFGYDGKGQTSVRPGDDPAEAWQRIARGRAGIAAVMEGFVPFEREGSVVIARGLDGAVAPFDLVENVHRDHILHRTIAPASVDSGVAEAARDVAVRIAETLDYVGVMGVELFLLPDGSLRVNELAPRPHNAGHWTMDGAATSQFEQAIRAVTGHPLGDPRTLFPCEMTNLIGPEIHTTRALLAEPFLRLHDYGKTEAREGRKMAHVTRMDVTG